MGEAGDEVSVARFIADQRTSYGVPHTVCCALLGVSQWWFYTWLARAEVAGPYTATERRRAEVDAAVAAAFIAARGLHGSPRLVADLRDMGWRVSKKTVAESMRRQGLTARRPRARGVSPQQTADRGQDQPDNQHKSRRETEWKTG